VPTAYRSNLPDSVSFSQRAAAASRETSYQAISSTGWRIRVRVRSGGAEGELR